MNTFTTYLHDMYTEMKNKVALSYNDDKRFIIPNTIMPYALNEVQLTEEICGPQEIVCDVLMV
ncbi:hypothetical protein NQ318_007518 [Aromia moschata]|uniref:Uncharacterized protein n=1 Tax=Aromia moschata TaxID=1265417 RepID=A0AAV8YEQ8_9CUCU|nr:hypothetical protein NQ318_007518 [Aromia moschata]